MSKIIIHNHSRKSDIDALNFVSKVMEGGFVSGENQYCFVSCWEREKIQVDAMNSKGDTYTFKVYDYYPDMVNDL